jgi:hypothetical protein
MNRHLVDSLIQLIVAKASPRRLVGWLSSGLLIAIPLPLSRELALAKHQHRHRKKHRRTPSPLSSCMPNCNDRTCGSDGRGGSCGECGANKFCQGGTCCTPQLPAATCVGRCGTWPNNCGQPVSCGDRPSGQACLAHGTCAVSCEAKPCPGFCHECNVQNSEAMRICDASATCSSQECTSTLECSPGMACFDCGFPTFRCGSVCTPP